jgi:hypothetical protein
VTPSGTDEEDTMTRRTTRLLPAAAAVLVLALTGCGSGAADDDRDADATAAEQTSDGASAAAESSPAASTELSVGDSATASKCMLPNAEVLATHGTAFEGTVTALEDGRATLQADRWFAGEETDQVTVSAPGDDLRALITAVEFEVGKTYLVSAIGDQVSLCGFTEEKTPQLEAMYTEAFGS